MCGVADDVRVLVEPRPELLLVDANHVVRRS
jgi:hypothetical protein